MWRRCFLFSALGCGVAIAPAALHGQADSAALNVSIPPGANFDHADFRLWLPPGANTVRAVVVLVPGSNADGRAMVNDTVWRNFAAAHHAALVACRFTDQPHDQNFIEEYVDVSRGTGQALIDALTQLGRQNGHPELAGAPLLLWGMSAGGEFNFEFAAWRPERVIAFIVNKGGIYYSALVSRAARDIPALLFVGGADLEFRTATVTGLFMVNRRAGARWALVNEPGLAHVVGHSRELGALFFDEVMTARLGSDGALRPLAEGSGWLGNLTDHTVGAVPAGRGPTVPTAWLPSERLAKAWQQVVTDVH
jgi:poly(3-hydroxybutyrate) depolymerase